jgi:dipeptidyl aminopeptidase/acylaminoacyl peptidase
LRRWGKGHIICDMMTRDFGLWDSPISPEMLTTSGTDISFIHHEQDALYWTERRPTENGRSVVCRYRNGNIDDVTPRETNVRSRVHEYGGLAFTVNNGRVVFINFDDQCLYTSEGEDLRRITRPGAKLAEPVVTGQDSVVVIVEEDGDPEPKNYLASVSLSDGTITPLVEGADFYSSPALSPDGKRIAWLSWNHPNMPWHGTELWVSDFDGDRLANPVRVHGGPTQTVFQPQWLPSGDLLFSAEPEGWWNLQIWDGDTVRSVYKAEREFGLPQWAFGMSTTAVCTHGIAALYCTEGLWGLMVIDHQTGTVRELNLPFSSITQLRSDGSKLSFLASSPEQARSLVILDPESGEWEIIRSSATVAIPQNCISVGEPISFATADGETAYAMLYLPANGQFQGPADRLPPLIVKSHGGPTGATTNGLSLGTLYWTSRGFAVADVNYRGSTGFGRTYRECIAGKWGIVDVEDCCAVAEHLVREAVVDPARLAITGGSAGGYTTLACLAFRDVFSVGASYYGVSDFAALASDTHKFESRYLDSLIGPWPEAREVYDARSPLYHTDGLSCPVIFFQGLEDRVVPPNQAQMMVDALKAKGVDVQHVEYAGEQHGFRRAENIMDAIEKERAFYLRTWNMK